jgi:hypothetical protein
MESAMTSREGRENLIPSVPIEIPSLTPMVLNLIPRRPSATTPSFTLAALKKKLNFVKNSIANSESHPEDTFRDHSLFNFGCPEKKIH